MSDRSAPFAALLVVMLAYLVWLFSLWVRFLGGLDLVLEIFGIGAGGAAVLLAAYAYHGRRSRRLDVRVARRRSSGQAGGRPPAIALERGGGKPRG